MKMQVLNSLDSFSITHDIPQCGMLKRPLIFGGVVKLRSMDERNAGGFRKFKAINCRASAASGAINSTSSAVEATSSGVGMKDGNLVFVAGATGRVGSRTVRELLKLGFRVRAGVRSAQRAESLVRSVQQMKLDGAASSLTPPIERLEIVECDLEKNEGIRGGLGNASIVICSIGASEKEVFDVTGPCRIDYRATKNLIDTASVAKVDHFILVTSLGTNKFGFPAAILNLFWGVLIWKRKAEEALLASGLPYTIVRPGGMERPTDAYKETHNITLSVEDTLFGGQVSNLQVAELMAFMAKNRSLSYCKVVEVIAETTAPLTPMEELLAKIPSQRDDGNVSKALGNVDRPGTGIPERSPPETPSISVESKSTQTKAAAPTPLSPYTAYEDLKPPTSPSPTPSTGAKLAANSSPVAVNSIIELPSIPTESEGKKASPLSPYINYEDLKPPTSPCPSPPSIGAKLAANSSPVAVNSIELPSIPTESEGKKASALSPYINYEDLKPPTSPCPSPPSIGAKLAANTSPVAVNSIELPSITTKSEVKKESPLSPYINYDDLKPPTSPTPNPPSGGSTIAAINVATKPEPAAAVKLETKTPLSPYTAYEDLKPPTSPIPTPSGPRE